MQKNRPSWQRTNLPDDFKVELWSLMTKFPTFNSWSGQVANNWIDDYQIKYPTLKSKMESKQRLALSRYTYKELKEQLKLMPDSEVSKLPLGLQKWVFSLPERQMSQDSLQQIKLDVNKPGIPVVSPSFDSHQSDLQNEAKWLIDLWLEALSSGHAPDGYIIDRDSAVFESIKLKSGDLLEGLLAHLKYEFPENFNHISKWESLFTNELTPQGFKSLRKAVRRGNFQGKCDICRN